MISLDGLEFPILRINERCALAARKPRDLRLMPETFFSGGGFRSPTYMIDSECRRYEVLDVRIKRRALDLFRLLWKHQMYVVEYEPGPPVQLSFEEARDSVIDLIVRHRWYGQGGETREKFIQRSRSYGSMREFIDNISLYGKNLY